MMNGSEIRLRRLINQQIAKTKFTKPPEIVSWMGAMQAQEYAMAKWSIGLRLPGIKDKDVESIFNRGEILRTHVLRPTWHFVVPSDIRWMLKLTAPRVHAANAYMYRKLELDISLFKRSNDILAKTLQEGNHLSREALKLVLENANIFAGGLRLSYLMMYAELEGIICSGPRYGKQFTYALLEERVPAAQILHYEDALAELSLRYFSSRGPATIRDFVHWSGLSVKDAKAGLSLVKSHFFLEKIDGVDHFFSDESLSQIKTPQMTFLMPDYDEYGIGYKDRTLIFFDGNIKEHIRNGNPVYDRMMIVDGKIAGTWKRTLMNDGVQIELVPFTVMDDSAPILKAAQRYGSFLEKHVTVKMNTKLS